MHDFLKDDYNLEALEPVQPAGDEFSMYVTPRFVATYARGYETLSTRIAKQQLVRQDLFIDVGAHYGYYSLLAAATNSDLRIISIEPIEDNLRVLKKNLAFNSIGQDRVTTFHAAVSSRAGRVQFCKSEASDNGSIYPHPSSATLAQIEIEAVCLDDVVGPEPPQRIFVKTDTDGHELEVLKGFMRTLEACDDVTILMEMNPKMMKIAGTGTPEILDFLHAQNFRVFAIDDGESRLYPLDQAANVAMLESRYKTSYYNVICIRKSRVLSVLFFSHSAQLAGAERSLLDLVRGLTGRGVLCSAVLPAAGPLRDELIQTGCAVHVPLEGLALVRGWCWADQAPGPSQAALASGLDGVAHALLSEVRKLAPDVVCSQTIVSPWGAWCAEVLGLPHVLSAREYGELDHQMTFALGFRPSVEALYASSEVALCITADVRDVLFGADSDRKTEVVYSGVEMSGVTEAPIASELNPVKVATVPMIGLMGTVVASKGQGDLVRAGIELDRRGIAFRVRIVGTVADPLYVAELRRELDLAGCADRFVWEEFTRDPAAALREAAVVVSCARREALGRTLLEAALLERPIVYADSGGPREIFISGEHGLAYEPGNPFALADALEAVLTDPDAARIRAQRVKEYVTRRFTEEAYTGKIFSILKDVAAQLGRNGSLGTPVRDLLRAAGLDVELSDRVRPKLYYADEANGFNDGSVLFHDEIAWGPFHINFELPTDGCMCLRFDPAELCAVELAIHECRFVTADGSVLSPDQVHFEANGEKGTGLSWKLETLNPSVVVKLAAQAQKMQIVGELKKLATSQLLEDWDAERQRQVQERTKVLEGMVEERNVFQERTQTLEKMIEDRNIQLERTIVRTRALEGMVEDQNTQQERAALRIQALEGTLQAWQQSVFGRLAKGADYVLEWACMPVRVGRYLFNPVLRKRAWNSLRRRCPARCVQRKPVCLPDLDWLLGKLDLKVPADQVLAKIGAYMTPQEEVAYGAMIQALRAAGEGAPSTVQRPADLMEGREVSKVRKRILFVCGEFPDPVHGGGGRVADFIKALSADHDVYVAAWYDRRRDHEAFVELAPYCKCLHGVSFEDLEAGCVDQLLDVIGQEPVDIVHYEWPRSLNSFDRRLGHHHIYTHMEAVSCSLWMDLCRMEPLSPDWLQRLAQLLSVLKLEALDAGQVDAQLVVTAKDGEFLSRFVAGKSYYVVNHGINRDEFDLPEQPSEAHTLVFTGNFIHYPNLDAMHYFMKEIRPLILKSIPDLHMWMVGIHPPAELKRYHDGQGVFVTGRVPDVRPYIQKATVCIAPLISGAGLRTKVVQYAALHRPSVVTPIAAEDLGFEDGREVCIADRADVFAARVVELLQNPSRAEEIADRARKRALECYDNTLIAKRDLGGLYHLLDEEERE